MVFILIKMSRPALEDKEKAHYYFHNSLKETIKGLLDDELMTILKCSTENLQLSNERQGHSKSSYIFISANGKLFQIHEIYHEAKTKILFGCPPQLFWSRCGRAYFIIFF